MKPRRSRQDAVVRNELSAAFPYTPLEEHFLDEDGIRGTTSSDSVSSSVDGSQEGGGSTTHQGVSTTIGCAKTGLWNLRYREEETNREFMRFCHRSLDGAVAMFIYFVGLLSWTATTPIRSTQEQLVQLARVASFVYALCLLVEVAVHCVKRAGTDFTFRYAKIRHASHVVAAILMLLNAWMSWYSDTTCQNAWEQGLSRPIYLACARRLNSGTITMIILGICTLRLDILLHFAIAHIFLLLHILGVFFATQSVPIDVVSIKSNEEVVTRILVGFAAVELSCLLAYARHKSLQRGLEAALEVHYRMRASARKMEAVDSMLSSMVPASALRQLLEGEKVLDYSPVATVLFSDMVQFTRWSASRSPAQVVQMLSTLVRGFDTLAAEMDVSKVKTIGDCYWAVTGIPTVVDQHAQVMINFGLAMLDLVKKEAIANPQWDYALLEGEVDVDLPKMQLIKNQPRRLAQFRTGIHSGPVHAGVLGTHQISYEIFGATSARANQVETLGVASRIAVSDQTKRLAEYKSILPYSFNPHEPELTSSSPLRLHEVEGVEAEGGEIEDDEEEDAPVVYLVVVEDSNHSPSLSRHSSSIHSGPNNETAEERARVQRRQYVERHLLKTSGGEDGQERVLSNATKEELLETHSQRKYCCLILTFEDLQVEQAFDAFAVRQLIVARIAGAVSLLLYLSLCFTLFLTDGKGPSISGGSLLVMLLGLTCVACSALLATSRYRELKGSAPDSEQEEVVNTPPRSSLTFLGDRLGTLLNWAGMSLWLYGCAFSHVDSVIVNDLGYQTGTVVLLLTIPNNHWPWMSVAFFGVFLSCVIPETINGATKLFPVDDVNVNIFLSIFGVLWISLLLFLHEKRLRVQFIEGKVATHFAQQQQVAIRAQQAVLASMVPDFVIAPLSAWLASDFDPSKAVASNYEGVSVAFIKLSGGSPAMVKAFLLQDKAGHSPKVQQQPDGAGSQLTSQRLSLLGEHEAEEEKREEEVEMEDDDQLSDWLYAGHRAVDAVLAQNSVVDKVKTVGDIVIVAGSFRGHSTEEASSTMLAVALDISQRFTVAAEDDERQREELGQCPACSSAASVGLHVGPVMGIVLGFSRLAFDIFGDTVNTTSRVLNGSVGKVCASEEFLASLPQEASPKLGPALHLKAKGKGILHVREVSREASGR